MIDKTWQVMNALQESFNNIATFDFMLTKLQEAEKEGNIGRTDDGV